MAFLPDTCNSVVVNVFWNWACLCVLNVFQADLDNTFVLQSVCFVNW